MIDREILIYIFLGIGLTLLIVGIFYRKWNLFSRFLILLVSITFFLLPGLYLSYLQYLKPHLPAEYRQKTDYIALRHIMKPNKIDDEWIRSATITWTTIDKIKDRLRYSDLDSYDSISFRDNYLDELPDFVWDMKNLKSLYLKNNKIETLPIEKIKNTGIKTIYIIGNPFTKENINKIKQLGIDINDEK